MEANVKAGENTVVLPAGTYTLDVTGRGEDAAATGDLDVTDHLRGRHVERRIGLRVDRRRGAESTPAEREVGDPHLG